jgi:hypothetical protein
MLHWYSKVTIILRKRKNVKETIIVRRREYMCDFLSVVLHVSRFRLEIFQFSTLECLVISYVMTIGIYSSKLFDEILNSF